MEIDFELEYGNETDQTSEYSIIKTVFKYSAIFDYCR